MRLAGHRVIGTVALGALLAAMPLVLDVRAGTCGFELAVPEALAKDGRGGKGGNDRGSSGKSGGRGSDRGGHDRGGGNDRGGDDRGGGNDPGDRGRGGDDRGGDDRGGRGRGADDAGGDDRGGRGTSARTAPGGGTAPAATERQRARPGADGGRSGTVVVPTGGAPRVEVSGGAIEVRYPTGWREELEAGRYQLKDPNNNTVVERLATPDDVRRLRMLAGN